MRIVTFANHKGGTGKTTSVICIATALGMSGRKVLAVDLDPQCFLTRLLGLPEPDPRRSSLVLFGGSARGAERAFLNHAWFDVLPGSSRLARTLRSLTRPTDVLWVRESLAQVECEHDVVILDTAAAVTVYSLGALVASHWTIIPVTPEYQPMVGAQQCFQTALTVREKLNPAMELPRFLLTQVDARKKAHATYQQHLRNKYRGLVLKGVVRTSASLAHATDEGVTVFERFPRSRGAVDYANVADELLRLLGLDRKPEIETSENGWPHAWAALAE